jgi:hypothetical protein
MGQSSPVAPDLKALRDHLVGKEVSALHIYGINSLKSVDPRPDQLTGDVIRDIRGAMDDRGLEISLGRHTIAIDLARTGTIVLLSKAQPWTASRGSGPPTACLILTDGTGIEFKEPARTKRITFSIRQT